ncbi:hypothetical protein GCM10010435_28460 [Winogradskya consettensis]|uniref:Uncharacterized protein n=1 Tax=Winogradskya consettensis TaxID=113560 RepID=A0A919VVJ7_9ACTN|nr:hypothetical protein Aco04nite_23050 [Actinoplanes consettensis]
MRVLQPGGRPGLEADPFEMRRVGGRDSGEHFYRYVTRQDFVVGAPDDGSAADTEPLAQLEPIFHGAALPVEPVRETR